MLLALDLVEIARSTHIPLPTWLQPDQFCNIL
jgi:hypothetical protein